MSMIPREEHPNPQFWRKSWTNLNGPWQFELDPGCSGAERGLMDADTPYSRSIVVPFCPESRLSGVENKDFMNCVWYRRSISLSQQELAGKVLLHFGAVDYECAVFVNGRSAGGHRGGYVSFTIDITEFVREGENILTVCAVDDTRSPLVPRGKQSSKYYSHGCDYTRTTGIWQTVWLEFVPKTNVSSVRYYAHSQDSAVTMEVCLEGAEELQVEVSYEGRPMGSYTCRSCGGRERFTVQLAEKHLWEVGCGRLYDVTFRYGEDVVNSYFGLRTVRFDGRRFLLNEKSVFQRMVLDQGFYPDGIYTAPTDADLRGDIQRSMDMGFNGARLHQKIFEPRFLYHCDRMGYMVWGEFPDWGMNLRTTDYLCSILPQWIEEVQRDFNHPAIIGWCPCNEFYDTAFHRDALLTIHRVTKALDETRPCIDVSGGIHVECDIMDIHDYDQNPDALRQRYIEFFQTEDPDYRWKGGFRYDGKAPVFLSEIGGIGWTEDQAAWAYGSMPKTKEEFLTRFRGLTEAVLFNKNIFGLCYTQLTDIEQEQNGLYQYDRTPKFEPAVLHAILSQKAAIEEE